MARYTHEHRGGQISHDPTFIGLQHQIFDLTKKLRDMQPWQPM